MPHATWLLRDAAAHLHAGPLRGAIEPRSPERGLFDIVRDQRRFADQEILGVALDPVHAASAGSLVDCYQRGGDLIATYAQTPERPVRVQVYWRAESAADRAPLVDLQVSVQTSLLDSRPRLATSSRLPRGELRRLIDARAGMFEPISLAQTHELSFLPEQGRECFLFRWPDVEASYVEIVYPGDSDCSKLKLCGSGRWELSHGLFSGELEKGVIVRARVRGAYLPRERDEELAALAYAEFLESDLPLTT
ncbi:MAG TPA: hypothetical protein VN699_03930 [Pirellulales bacterium]|nr:hypothetical protein [Pirellulales bacterium]